MNTLKLKTFGNPDYLASRQTICRQIRSHFVQVQAHDVNRRQTRFQHCGAFAVISLPFVELGQFQVSFAKQDYNNDDTRKNPRPLGPVTTDVYLSDKFLPSTTLAASKL